MEIRTIDHLEYYVGDARQAAFYLCTAFGFRIIGQGGPETGLAEQRSLLLGHGGIRILLTTGLTAAHPASAYVARHGDGVAVVGMRTDSVADTLAKAVSCGATQIEERRTFHRGDASVVTAVVSGFGDVTHRLVQRDDSSLEFLPGAIDMMSPDPDRGDDLLLTIDHLAVCVPAGELASTSRYYQDVFGWQEIFTEYIDLGSQAMDSKVVQSDSREVTFTIIEPDISRRPGQIDDFLRWHGGAGVQHIAFRTDDIVAAIRTFQRRGVAFSVTPGGYYDDLQRRLGHVDMPVAVLRELGVLVDQDHWGQMYQIFTQSMHVRRTLFLELIERHGALTFGSSNIRALYEAKERELRSAASTAAAIADAA
jgi:4-hydroxymandelate synthase